MSPAAQVETHLRIDPQDVSLAQVTHSVWQLPSMHWVAGSQSCGQVLAVSVPLHVPLLQPVGGQSNGQVVLVSPVEQVRSPQAFVAAGQSIAQLVVVSPESQVPLPHTGPLDTHLKDALQTMFVPHAPQLPLHAGGLPHLYLLAVQQAAVLQSCRQLIGVSPASHTPLPHRSAIGQSIAQVLDVSVLSQIPLPHLGPVTQSAGHVLASSPVHLPSPQTAPPEHADCAHCRSAMETSSPDF